MQRANIKNLIVLGHGLLMILGCASVPHQGGRGLPTCIDARDCAAGPLTCAEEDQRASIGPAVLADSPTGLSSDGRGAYRPWTDGVRHSIVREFVSISFNSASDSIKNPRHYAVNLNHPVPRGGGVPRGIVTAGRYTNIEIQWVRVGDARRNLHDIPIGQTVTAGMMAITFHMDGHFHVLQAGPMAYGHCHAAPTRVSGTGTSSGTIYRASATKWVMDLPAGSVARLFDLFNTDQYAVDKGLYYTDLHIEIGN